MKTYLLTQALFLLLGAGILAVVLLFVVWILAILRDGRAMRDKIMGR